MDYDLLLDDPNMGWTLHVLIDSYTPLTSMDIDQNNVLWLGTSQGLVSYDPDNLLDPNNPRTFTNSLLYPNEIVDITADANYVWIARTGNLDLDDGLHRFDKNTHQFTLYNYDTSLFDSISCRGVDSAGDGTVWALSFLFGVYRYKVSGNAWDYFLPSGWDTLVFNSIKIGHSGDLWLGSDDSGLWHFQPDPNVWDHWEASEFGLPSNNIRALGVYEDANRIIVVTNEGIARYDLDFDLWQPIGFPASVDLEEQVITDVMVDTVGTMNHQVWFGTQEGGLYRWKEGALIWTSPANGSVEVPLETSTIEVVFNERINDTTVVLGVAGSSLTFEMLDANFMIINDPDIYNPNDFTWRFRDSGTDTHLIIEPREAGYQLHPNTYYRFKFTSAILDQSGLPILPPDYDLQFKTLIPSEVTDTDPDPDETGVALDATITITFNKLMDHTSFFGFPSNIRLQRSGYPVENIQQGETSFLDANNRTILYITKSGGFVPGSQYTLTMINDVTDLFGNPLAEDLVLTFTTVLPAAYPLDPYQAWPAVAIDPNGITIDPNDIGFSAMGISPADGSLWTGLASIDSGTGIWTGLGLYRFDGIGWTHYTASDPNCGLTSDYITDVAFDSTGNVWVATEPDPNNIGGGVARFDGQDWSLYSPASDPSRFYIVDRAGLTPEAIQAFFRVNAIDVYPTGTGDLIWIATTGGIGVGQYDANLGDWKWSAKADPQTLHMLAADPVTGTIWLESGNPIWDPSDPCNYIAGIDALKFAERLDQWPEVWDPNIWAWNPNGGLPKVRLIGQVRPFLRGMTVDGNGSLWLAAYDGLYTINIDNLLLGVCDFVAYDYTDTAGGLLYDSIYEVTKSQDDPNLLWVVTSADPNQGAGISSYDVTAPTGSPDSWARYAFAGDEVFTVFPIKNGGIMAGTSEGLLIVGDNGSPAVTGSYPSDSNTNIPVCGPFWVQFSELMDTDGVQAVFSLMDASSNTVAGSFSWEGTRLIFTPSSPLITSTLYSMRVAATGEDLSGNPLSQTYQVSFRTSSGWIVSTSPHQGQQEVSIAERVVIRFDRAMDPNSVQGAFCLKIDPDWAGPGYSCAGGSFVWPAAQYNEVLYFYPNQPLSQGMLYIFSIEETARDSIGNAMPSPLSIKFVTRSDSFTSVLPGDPIIFQQDQNRRTNRKLNTRIASNGEGYLCVWQEHKGTERDVHAQLLDREGAVQGDLVTVGSIAGNQRNPDVGSDGDRYLVVWADGRNEDPDNTEGLDIYGAIVSAQGDLVDEVPIAAGTGSQNFPRVKWHGDHYLVVWEDWTEHDAEKGKVSLYGKRLDADGAIIDQDPVEISTDMAYNKKGIRPCFDIASLEDPNGVSWIVAWSGSVQDPSEYGLDILARFIQVDPSGTLELSLLLAQIPISGLDQYNPSVEGLNNQFLVVWEQWADDEGTDTDVWGIMLNMHGEFAGGLINIGSASKKQRYPELATNGRGFFAVWLDQRDSTTEQPVEHIYGIRISPEGYLLQDDPESFGGTRLSEDANQFIWLTDAATPGGDDDRYFCLWSARDDDVWTLQGRMYDPPPPPWLEWVGIDDYEEDGVNPDQAAGGSIFTFKVKYFSDPEIDEGPEVAQVWIDLDGSGRFGSDERFDMTAEGSGDFTLGRAYTLQKKILYDGEGTLTYRFFFADPYNVATGDPAEGDTFEVELVGKRPFLDWTEEVGFTADGARPDGIRWGESSSIEFRVLYQDENNDAPATKRLWVDRNEDGYYDPNEVWDMHASGSDYQNGEIFTTTLTLESDEVTTMTYRFEFDDGKNRSTGEPLSGSYLSFNPLGETAACLNTHQQLFPSITVTLDGYQVFWQDSRDWELDADDALIKRSHIYMELLDANMRVMDAAGEPGQIKLDTGDMGAFKPSAIHSKATGKTLVIWEDLRNGATIDPSEDAGNYFKPEAIYEGLDIYGIFLDENGTPFTDTGNANEAGEFVIADASCISDPSIDRNALNPAMAMGYNGQYLVAWEDESKIARSAKTDIHARFVNHPGGAFGEVFELKINNWAETGGELGDEHQLLPRVAWNGEYYMVVWMDVAGASPSSGYHYSRIYGLRISPGGDLYPEGVGFKLFDEDYRADPNRNQILPDIASDGNDFLVVWQDDRFVNTDRGYDIYGMRINSNGEALDLPFKEIPICTADGYQVRPRVVWDPQGNQYLISWLDIAYELAPEDMLAHRLSVPYPRTGNVRVVRMDSNGRLLDGSPVSSGKYEGMQPVGVSLSQDRPAMTCDSASGCAFIWEDIRNSRSYDLYTTSFQTTLNWVDEDDYGNKGVHPASASPGETFTFKVHYRDRLENPPAKAQVWIDLNDDGDFEDEGEKIDMGSEDPNATMENGMIYTYSKEIGFPEDTDGVLAYRFYFEDENGAEAPGIASGINFLTLTITEAPQLDWAGGTGFTSDGVAPNQGDSGSLFVFKVKYTDPANIEPEVTSVWIDIDDSGAYGSTEKLLMKEEDEDDVDYSDGKIYTLSVNLTYRGDGTINYRFYFHNGVMEAQGDPTEDHSFRINEFPPSERWTFFHMDEGPGDGPAGNYVTCLEVDGDNVLWAGFYPDQDDPENFGGVSSYDGDVWRTFREGSGIPGNSVVRIAITPDDEVWIGTWEGIARYDGSQWETVLDIVDPNSFVSSLIAGGEGQVWFSTYPTQDPDTLEISDSVLTKYENGIKTLYSSREKLGGNWISALAADQDGRIWAGVTDVRLDANQMVVFDYKGIVVLDPDTEEIVEYSKSQGTYPGGDLVRTIYVDDEGDVWVGSQDPGTSSDYAVPLAMGLSHFDADQDTWTQYKNGVGGVKMGSNMVTAVCRRGNDLYIGHWPESETLIGGATHHNLATGTWQLLNSDTEPVDTSFNAISDIVIDEGGNVWFGTIDGLVRYSHPSTVLTFMDSDFKNGVSPQIGMMGTHFEFRVDYLQKENDPPDAAQVWIDLNDDGAYTQQEMFDMLPCDPYDQNYANGMSYYFSIPIDYMGDGYLSYRFHFERDGISVPGTPSEDHELTVTDYCIHDDSGSLDIIDAYGMIGYEILIPVKVQNAPNSVESFSFEITYNPSILEYTGFFPGKGMANFDFFDVIEPEGAGTLRIGGFELGDDSIQSGSHKNIIFLEFFVIGCEGFDIGTGFDLRNLEDDFEGWTISGGCFTCIDDIEPPVPEIDPLPDIVAECSVVLNPPTAIDDYAGHVEAMTNDPLIYMDQGTYEVTWVYDDGFGNLAVQEQRVEIADKTAPTVYAGNDMEVEEIGLLTLTATASDNCSNDLVYEWYEGGTLLGKGNPLNYKFNAGTHAVELIVTDKGGNFAIDTVVIRVKNGSAGTDTFFPPYTPYITGIPPYQKITFLYQYQSPLWTPAGQYSYQAPNLFSYSHLTLSNLNASNRSSVPSYGYSNNQYGQYPSTNSFGRISLSTQLFSPYSYINNSYFYSKGYGFFNGTQLNNFYHGYGLTYYPRNLFPKYP
ncbi:MAG: Ig-like domain-containing protein [bacterium]